MKIVPVPRVEKNNFQTLQKQFYVLYVREKVDNVAVAGGIIIKYVKN